MSSLNIYNYPISINTCVTNSNRIEYNEKKFTYSFSIQFTSNITSWNIERTLSEFEELNAKLQSSKELKTIKLPRTITKLSPSRFQNISSANHMIEDYLWRLLRRAYVFINLHIRNFIELPLIMEQKTNLLAQQLLNIIREDHILYSADSQKYKNIRCILRASYTLDVFQPTNHAQIHYNELDEGFNEFSFGLDVVQIKRVLRYQKEFKFCIETRKGQIHAFKCSNCKQFNLWVNDLKNMIKATNGFTPYLTKYSEESLQSDCILSDEYMDYSDHENGHGPLSVLGSVIKISPFSPEQHSVDDRVDVDIESCLGIESITTESVSSHNSHSNVIKFMDYNVSELKEVENSQQNVSMIRANLAQKLSPVSDKQDSEKNDENNMVSMEEYNRLKEELSKWQSTAQRWQNMAKCQEQNQETNDLQSKQKDIKYKNKIREQKNEILALHKMVKKKQYEIDKKILELKQLESVSQVTIEQLLSYKRTNEMRKKNSYIDGTLWKFAGDGMNNVKFNKAPKLKYVMYVPTKRRLYYSDSTMDDADTKLVNVTDVTHKNDEVMHNLPDKYKRIWIKITGKSRIVLFVAKNKADADRWYVTIKNSLRNDD